MKFGLVVAGQYLRDGSAAARAPSAMIAGSPRSSKVAIAHSVVPFGLVTALRRAAGSASGSASMSPAPATVSRASSSESSASRPSSAPAAAIASAR